MNEEKRTLNEEIWVAGKELAARLRELLAEGNVRRLIVRNEAGKKLLEIPLTGGVVLGGALVVLAPFLAAIAAIAAVAKKVKVEIVRDPGNNDDMPI